MRNRIPVGLIMMLAAIVMSVVPAATVTARPAAALSTCDAAQFISDVTVPDGTNFTAGTAFKKTWRLKNIGTCTWTTSYSLAFSSGEKMGGPTSVNLPASVAPGQTVDLSLNLTAPNAAGHFIGYWLFKNASGTAFGIGSAASSPWWVEINVSAGSVEGDAYDFAPNVCTATWSSGAGVLPCPGTDGDARGFVLQVNQPKLEDGTVNAGGGILAAPQNVYNGDIHGVFPAFHVQTGDKFQSVVNCAYGATNCYVTFRLDYQIGNGPVNTLWSFKEKYEGLYYSVNIDLSALAGQDVKFILTTLATGSATGDRSMWVNPHIVRPGGVPITPVPTTPSPPTVPPSSCDRAQFIADVTVPDGTTFAPGAAFTKTWRLKNVGSCTWTTSYAMVFDTGEQMGGPASVAMPKSVVPGDTVDVSVNLTAPNTAGSYRGYWKFKNASGVRFGLGSDGTKSWWVDIKVSGTPVGRNYDFGTGTSPVAAGYTRVTESTTYTAGNFGWTDTSTLESRDRSGVTDSLKRDFVMSSSAARYFKVDLPNGSYAVTVTMGDQDYPHDNMQVKANATTMLPDVDTAAGSFAVNTFYVTVSTGTLELAFSDQGGTDSTWVVNGVTITAGSPPSSNCNRASLVADVTVPDGTLFAPGAQFVKTWRLKNVGTCTWTTSYSMVFDSGNQMNGPASVALPNSVAPGQTVDMTVTLNAPNAGGSYRGYWKFQAANGARFGIGSNATTAWWVDIKVSGPTATPGTPTPGTTTPSPTPVQGAMYDFASNACSAVWLSGAVQLPNTLPCPGTDGDQRGFVLKLANPQLENGTVDSRLGLVTYPQNVYNGYIQGIYPPYHVKTGDRFRSTVNCAYGATSCYVVFRLDYQTGTGPITTFWAFVEKYEGQYYNVDLDLSSLVGKDVKFILTVLSTGSATGDRAMWVGPIIYNGTGVTATPTQTFTATPTATGTPTTPTATSTTPTATATSVDTSGWNTYQNVKYGFFFKFPPGSSIASQSDNAGRVYLPFTAGTNLVQKYVDVSVVEGAATCKSPNTSPMATSTNVTINGIQFLKETGSEGAAGNLYDWTGYSTVKGTACISLTFVLHSTNPGVYPTPPTLFDPVAESAIFPAIMSTYGNQ